MNRYLFLIIILTLGCSKSNSNLKDTQPPVITLNSPTPNQLFSAGASVSISGTVTDNEKVSELHVHIYNNTTGALVMDIHRYPLTANYALNESFTTQSGVPYKIQVIAKDNSANQSQASVEISTQ